MPAPGARRRSRLGWLALALLLLLFPLDLLVFRRDSRASWMRALPIGVLRQGARLFPSDPVLQFAIGSRLYAEGRYPAAAQSLQKAVSRDPGFLLAKAEYANLLVDLGWEAQAYAITRECLAGDERLAAALVARGRLHARRQEWRKAGEFADRALAVEPDRVDAWLLRGQVLQAQGAWGEAAAAAGRVVRQRPQSGEGWILTASCALQEGDAPRAAASAERAVRLQPSSARAQRILGVALLESSDPAALARAEAVIREAMRLAPADSQAQVALGRLMVRQHRWQEAEAHLREMVRRWPKANEGRSLLAAVCRARGDAREERRWTAEHARWQDFAAEESALLTRLQKVVYDQEIRLELARLYARMDLLQDALVEINRSLSRGPDPEGLALRGELLRRARAAHSGAGKSPDGGNH